MTAQTGWMQQRRHELDALRVLAIFLLILYHVGMFYVADWDWHVKSEHSSEFLQNLMLWSSQWRMSLLFFISGAALAFVIPRMTYWQFYKERNKRLIIPLIFGIAVIVPPQAYYQMIQFGGLREVGYLRFWLAYLNPADSLYTPVYDAIPGTKMTWNHLWFLMYIFAYSFALFALVRLGVISFLIKLLNKTNGWQLSALIITVPAMLLALFSYLLRDNQAWTHSFINDWPNHSRFLLITILGCVFVQTELVWKTIGRLAPMSLAFGLVSFGMVLYSFHGGSLGMDWTKHLVWKFNNWIWILVMVGFGIRFLSSYSKVFSYLNKGVYTYYMVHQTLIVMVGFNLSLLRLGFITEAILLIAISILLTLGTFVVISKVKTFRDRRT